MIKYQLRCLRGHEFEAWFANSDAFDKLARRGQVSCVTCGSARVEKAMMSPRIAKSVRSGEGSRANEIDADLSADPSANASTGGGDGGGSAGALAAQTSQMEPTSKASQALRAAFKAAREEILRRSDYVGPRFAEEARRMHDDEAPVRGIYGEASLDEARSLIEDGISILLLPPAPDEHN